MAVSPNATQGVLELLADIRRTQSKSIERMSDNRHHTLQFEHGVNKLADRISLLRSTIPAASTDPQVVGLRRDVKEFVTDLAALKGRIDELIALAADAKADMAEVKMTLDVIQTRIENSDS